MPLLFSFMHIFEEFNELVSINKIWAVCVHLFEHIMSSFLAFASALSSCCCFYFFPAYFAWVVCSIILSNNRVSLSSIVGCKWFAVDLSVESTVELVAVDLSVESTIELFVFVLQLDSFSGHGEHQCNEQASHFFLIFRWF